MKMACKVICRILGIFMGFVIINLIVGTIIYGGVQNYSQILNDKNWEESLSQIRILKPKTRVSMFYQINTENIESQDLDADTQNDVNSDVNSLFDEILGEESQDNQIEEGKVNPYDPDYEDEFNSFFGDSNKKTGDLISVEEIEDLSQAGFVVKDDTEN